MLHPDHSVSRFPRKLVKCSNLNNLEQYNYQDTNLAKIGRKKNGLRYVVSNHIVVCNRNWQPPAVGFDFTLKTKKLRVRNRVFKGGGYYIRHQFMNQ